MANQKLPTSNSPTILQVPSHPRTQNRYLKPTLTLSSIALTLGGAVGAFEGLGFFGIALALAGSSLFFLNRFFIKSPGDLSKEFEKQEAERLKELKRQIRKTQYLENVGDLGERAALQLEAISKRFDQFTQILLQKFQRGEITFSRYYSAGEQTYLAVLENLKLNAASLNQLNLMHGPSPTDQELRHTQKEKLIELFNLNDEAIREFDKISSALLAIRTQKGEADVEVDQAMAELAELAGRAKKYSKQM